MDCSYSVQEALDQNFKCNYKTESSRFAREFQPEPPQRPKLQNYKQPNFNRFKPQSQQPSTESRQFYMDSQHSPQDIKNIAFKAGLNPYNFKESYNPISGKLNHVSFVGSKVDLGWLNGRHQLSIQQMKQKYNQRRNLFGYKQNDIKFKQNWDNLNILRSRCYNNRNFKQVFGN